MTSTPTPEPGPHSRACGWRPHDHGSACSTNCPTCHGRPAPSTPGEGDGRPGGWVEGIGWVALLTSLPTGTYYSWFETDTERNWRMVGDPYTVMRLKRYSVHGPAIVRRWADGTTPAPPAPSPCPYIVTGGEGTSHCSLAERSAMHAAAPPSTPADPRPTDPTGSEA